ncbi:MAG: hypothetical protein U0L51_05425 [Olegusella sp.]|nr:hypothetical protein [Olegusella sp.]
MALNWNKDLSVGGPQDPSAADKVAQQGDEPTTPATPEEISDLTDNGLDDISWAAAEGIGDMRYGAAPLSASVSEPEPVSGPAWTPEPALVVPESEPTMASEPMASFISEPTVPISEPIATTPDPAPAYVPEVTHVEIPDAVSVTLPAEPAKPAEPEQEGEPKQEHKPKSLGDLLNQPIGGKKDGKGKAKGRGRGAGAWPSKRTINLYVPSDSGLNVRHTVILAVCLAIFLVVFVRFAVLGPLAHVAQLQSELADRQATLAQIDSGLTDYNDIKDVYDAYNVQTSSTGIDVLGALDMVDRYVKQVAIVDSEDLEGNVLTLNLSGANLDTYGNLATTLMTQPSVSGVSVSTADNQDSDSSDNVTATITVTLRTIAETNAQVAQGNGSNTGANALDADGDTGPATNDAAAGSAVTDKSSQADATGADTVSK